MKVHPQGATLDEIELAYLGVGPTSLAELDAHDWAVLNSRWNRGIDWNVSKLGSQWKITSSLPQFTAFPLFKTKTAAWDAFENLMMQESRWRALQRLREECR